LTKLGTYLILKRVWNLIDFQGQGHQVKFLPYNILVNTLESTSFNGKTRKTDFVILINILKYLQIVHAVIRITILTRAMQSMAYPLA
jgi:hypothetical protein